MTRTVLEATPTPNSLATPKPGKLSPRGDNLDVALAKTNDFGATTLLGLGANPNGIVDEATGTTALGACMNGWGGVKGRTMMLALAAADEAPVMSFGAPAGAGPADGQGSVRTYFDWVLDTAARGSNNGQTIRMFDLARQMNEVLEAVDPTPPSWKKAIGDAFLRTSPENEFWRGEGRVDIFFDMLKHASFDGPDEFAKAATVIAEQLVKDDKVDAVVTLAKRLVDMGGHPDQITMVYNTGIWGPRQCTVLHGAARRDLGELVSQLLELGADPSLGSDNGAGPNAYELVLGNNKAKGVLNAWKSKTAIESVIRGAGRLGQPAGA